MVTSGTLPPFGIVGIVDFDSGPPAGTEKLVGCFRRTPQSVLTEWDGKHFWAVTCQHCEDAGLAPGTYRAKVRVTGSQHALVFGQFFDQESARASEPVGEGFLARQSARLASLLEGSSNEAFRSLNGMWVAATVDSTSRTAAFARDTAGVETLYVCPVDGQIAFASDLRMLVRLGVASSLDEQALYEFLHFLYVPAPRSVYAGIRAVLPGHVLLVRGTSMEDQRFAPPRFVTGEQLHDPEKIQAALDRALPEFEQLLLQAVRESLPRTGRVALLLSGGKDSAALAIALSQLAPERTLTVTVPCGHTELDESDDARSLATFLGLAHQTSTLPPGDFVSAAREMASCMDQPFGDTASLALHLALRGLPDDVRCVFDGTGNDYYFGSIRHSPLERAQRAVELKRRFPGPLWDLLRVCMHLGPRRFRSQASEWSRPLGETAKSWNGWTQQELAALAGRSVSFDDTRFYRILKDRDLADWRNTITELSGGEWSPNGPYRKGVHLAHEHGLPIRYPFVDDRVAAFVAALPQELKYQGYTNKILLRAYLGEYLPERFLIKRKGSFVFDLNHLLLHNHREWIRALSEEQCLQVLPSWSLPGVASMLSAHARHPGDFADKVYALCLLAEWNRSR